MGSTNVLLWDGSNRLIDTIDVEVTHDLDGLKEKLHQLLPGENINVHSSQGIVVLSGQVSDVVKMESAVQLARSFAMRDGKAKDPPVLNLLQVGGAQQVMLEVKVAEMARTLVRSLSAKFNATGANSNWKIGGVNGGASFPRRLIDVPQYDPGTGEFKGFVQRFVPAMTGGPISPTGPDITTVLPNDLSIEDKGLFATFLSKDLLFNLALDAAQEHGLAKILAEPTLTTLTGQEAQFLSGGEFPIPVPNGLNGTTIEFKEFGVGLKFIPVVLNSGQINLKINISVSELTSPNSVLITSRDTPSTFVIPALTKRSAASSVEVGDGQTIGIAGLISEDLREAVNKFPGLGDVPVLGTLFRSQEFQKGQTELVMFVTPHLARPVARASVRLPTDGFVEPGDAEFYLLGRMEGRHSDTVPPAAGGGAEGSFGHQVE